MAVISFAIVITVAVISPIKSNHKSSDDTSCEVLSNDVKLSVRFLMPIPNLIPGIDPPDSDSGVLRVANGCFFVYQKN